MTLKAVLEHGLAGYRDGCTCAVCRSGNARYGAAWTKRRILGQSAAGDQVDATGVQAHLVLLLSRGLSCPQIALRCGLSATHVWRLATGRTRRVRRDTREAVYRVRPGG